MYIVNVRAMYILCKVLLEKHEEARKKKVPRHDGLQSLGHVLCTYTSCDGRYGREHAQLREIGDPPGWASRDAGGGPGIVSDAIINARGTGPAAERNRA